MRERERERERTDYEKRNISVLRKILREISDSFRLTDRRWIKKERTKSDRSFARGSVNEHAV